MPRRYMLGTRRRRSWMRNRSWEFRPGMAFSPHQRPLCRGLALGLLAREFLETLDDHVAIERIDFHQECAPPSLFGGDQGRTAAAEQVEHMLTRTRGILHGADGEFDRLLGEVHHVVMIDLFYGPDIDRVVGAKPDMRRTQVPPVEAPLVVAEKILAGEYRVLFDPNDRLGEIQGARLQNRRVGGAVGPASPEVESP